jgi:hypothetical protein
MFDPLIDTMPGDSIEIPDAALTAASFPLTAAHRPPDRSSISVPLWTDVEVPLDAERSFPAWIARLPPLASTVPPWLDTVALCPAFN